MAFDTTYEPTRPEEAIAHFKKQLELTEEEIEELGEISERRGFFVSGVADLDLLTDVWDALDKALADGTGFDQFVDDIGERLETEWGGTVANPGWRQETIYRTNLQKSYNAGRYKQATDPDVIEDRPYWLFDATLDERTTEICEKCNGTIRPADDEWWAAHSPPLHFQCRSSFITLTEEQAESMGGAVDKPTHAKADDGFGKSPDVDDWEPDVEDYPDEFREQVEKVIGAK